MKTIGFTVLSALIGLALVGSPALAAKRKAPAVSCKQIKDAMASGKTAEEVEKDLHVSAATVKKCTAEHKSRGPAKKKAAS